MNPNHWKLLDPADMKPGMTVKLGMEVIQLVEVRDEGEQPAGRLFHLIGHDAQNRRLEEWAWAGEPRPVLEPTKAGDECP